MISSSVFIDTSWFKAFIDNKDDFYEQASKQYKMLSSQKTNLITTNFIIDETLTLLRVRRGLVHSLKFRDLLVEMINHLKVVRVLSTDENLAWNWFPKSWSKLSFTDCTSFAVMQRLGLKDVATFDDHFARAGFNMLS